MLLKSLFISAFPTFLAVAAAFAGWQIVEDQFVIANIFVLVAVVPLATIRPAGNVSRNAKLAASIKLAELSMVKVRVVVAP